MHFTLGKLGIVLNEAKRFRNYMVSTDVGGARDLIEQEKYGSFVKQEDGIDLSRILSLIVNDRINIDVYQDFDIRRLSYQREIRILLRHL